jgi:hypothetical protein
LPAAITLKPYKRGQRRLGFAKPGHCVATVYITGNLAEDLSTVLHELAHLAAPGHEHHGERWRELFIAAVAEACGCDPDAIEPEVVITDLDSQVLAEVAAWLIRSGQHAVLKAALRR